MQHQKAFPSAERNAKKRAASVRYQQNLHPRPHLLLRGPPFSYANDQHVYSSPDLMPSFQNLDITAGNGWPESDYFDNLNFDSFDAWTCLFDDSLDQIMPLDPSPTNPDQSEPSLPVLKSIMFEPQTNTFGNVTEHKAEHKKEKRRAQNRKAQRAHRERRDMTHCLTRTKVLQLECALATAVEQDKFTRAENDILRAKLVALEAQICSAEGSEMVSVQRGDPCLYDTTQDDIRVI